MLFSLNSFEVYGWRYMLHMIVGFHGCIMFIFCYDKLW